MTEVLVAAIVLTAVLSVVTQVVVRSGRLRMDCRHYRVALDELSNQLDRLTALDDATRQTELESIAPSPNAQSALASPELTAKLIEDGHGRRLLLSLNWRRPGGAPPMTLVGWLPPAAATNGGDNP